MHQRTKLRRLALACAVPVAAIGGIALTAHAASSSPTAVIQAQPSDLPVEPSPQNPPPAQTGRREYRDGTDHRDSTHRGNHDRDHARHPDHVGQRDRIGDPEHVREPQHLRQP